MSTLRKSRTGVVPDPGQKSSDDLTESYLLIEAFREDLVACGRAPDTIKNYLIWLHRFQTWLGADLRSAGRDEFRKYIVHMRERGLAHATLRSQLAAISTFYIYLEDENQIEVNQVPTVTRKYLRSYKGNVQGETRQYITPEQASRFIGSIMPARDKAIGVFLAKTGLRAGELARLELEDVDIEGLTLSVKPHPKRTNCTVFFDYEAAECLENYLPMRGDAPGPLFQSSRGGLRIDGIEYIIKKAAIKQGLHKPGGPLKERFTPHCFRHCFTTWLDERGMKREYIEILRGDAGKAVIDRYIHSTLQRVKESYLACIPQLGI